MDHMGDWMLPSVALALVVIAGIVLVAFDDIVLALVRPRRGTGAEPFDSSILDEAAQIPRRGRLTRHAKHLLQRRRTSRSSTKIALPPRRG